MKKIYVKLLFVCSLLLIIGCFRYQEALTWLDFQYQVKQQEKIVRAKDAITKGMDADKAQKVIEKSSDKVDNLLKKFEKHGKKIDKHLAKKK